MRQTIEEVNGHEILVFEDCKKTEIGIDRYKPMYKMRILVDHAEVIVKEYDGELTSKYEFERAVDAAKDAVVGMCEMFDTIK